ncbi:hypothetical protein [Paraburkholderia sp. DHOC27]|uniref:hypothetical protein n=1 Tax=Paraburkholderia sp. DHOC27 TaxID=2303330 RepID=UPI0011C0DAFC|nr:hypothetical protein [Paraburkholderia sp. DHOC27]
MLFMIALLPSAAPAEAYSVKTYQASGGSRIEACTLVKQNALSQAGETAHGRMTKISACKCDIQGRAGVPQKWQCQVQTIHAK